MTDPRPLKQRLAEDHGVEFVKCSCHFDRKKLYRPDDFEPIGCGSAAEVVQWLNEGKGLVCKGKPACNTMPGHHGLTSV